jgi:chromate transport protein ChrA
MTQQDIENWTADSVAQLAITMNAWGRLPVAEGWYLCLAVAIAALILTAVAMTAVKSLSAAYIEYKKKQVVKEEWGMWRSKGLPKEALHAAAYYCFALILLKVGFEFARASGLQIPMLFDIAANAIAFLVLLLYALRQLKERHKGDKTDLTVRFASYTLLAMIALHHSDIIRRFAAPATVYALNVIPL